MDRWRDGERKINILSYLNEWWRGAKVGNQYPPCNGVL